MTETSQNLAFLPQNNKKDLHFCKPCGADTRIRTGDLILTKEYKNITNYFAGLVVCWCIAMAEDSI